MIRGSVHCGSTAQSERSPAPTPTADGTSVNLPRSSWSNDTARSSPASSDDMAHCAFVSFPWSQDTL